MAGEVTFWSNAAQHVLPNNTCLRISFRNLAQNLVLDLSLLISSASYFYFNY